MFSAVMLTGTGAAKQSPGGSITPIDPPPGGDDEWEDSKRGSLMLMPADGLTVVEPESVMTTDQLLETAEPELPVIEVPDIPSVLDDITGDEAGDVAAPGAGE